MEDWQQLALDLLERPVVQAGLVVLASLVLAKLVDLLFTRVLLRFTLRPETELDEKIGRLLHQPIFITTVLVGLHFGVRELELEASSHDLSVKLIKTMAVVLWAVIGLRLASTLISGLARLADRVKWLEARTVPLFDNVAKILLVGGAIYALLVVWGLDVRPWLASAGVIGIAVGFAAKDTLANLFGGLFIIVDAPYKIGDYVNLDNGERGQVTSIGLRSTRLLTRDDVELVKPDPSHLHQALDSLAVPAPQAIMVQAACSETSSDSSRGDSPTDKSAWAWSFCFEYLSR